MEWINGHSAVCQKNKMLRSKKEVEEKLKHERSISKKFLKAHVNENDEHGSYLRLYNKSIEKVLLLEWFLGLNDY